MSTKPSGGSGEILYLGGEGGTDSPKWPAVSVISKMSEKPLLSRSAGQELAPQCASAFVPAEFSTEELKPSQSGSLARTGHGGMVWAGFGQFEQLSEAFSTPSASLSSGGVPGQSIPTAIVPLLLIAGAEVAPAASTCALLVRVSGMRPDAPALTNIVRRSTTPAALSGVPMPVSTTAPVNEPSVSGTESLPPAKSEEPLLTARRKLESWAWIASFEPSYWRLYEKAMIPPLSSAGSAGVPPSSYGGIPRRVISTVADPPGSARMQGSRALRAVALLPMVSASTDIACAGAVSARCPC
jgi:hypothetical protein